MRGLSKVLPQARPNALSRLLTATPSVSQSALVTTTVAVLVAQLASTTAAAQSIPIQDNEIYTAPAGNTPPSTLGGPTVAGEVTIVRERFFEDTPPIMTGSGLTLTPGNSTLDGRFSASILFRSGPVTDNSRDPETEAIITFPAGVTVIGVIESDGNLGNTDATLGLSPTINYTASARGMEGGELSHPDPFFLVNGDGTTEIRFQTNMNVTPFTDEFRVLIDYGDSFDSSAQMRVETFAGDDINVGDTELNNAAAANVLVPLTIDSPCYIASNATDALSLYSRGDSSESAIGAGFGVSDVFSMAFDPNLQRMVATNGNTFGIINRTTGLFAPVGTIGSITRGATTITVDNVQGLAFDPNSNALYAVQRRTTPVRDVLFLMDPNNGTPIVGAFGGEDYVEIEIDSGKDDVDDIAIDPISGLMFALADVGVSETRLMNIDPATGSILDLGEVTGGHNVQGLSFDPTGDLFGVTAGGVFLELSPADGAPISTFSLTVGGDHEALECSVAPANILTGEVFEDADFDGIFNGGEVGTANVAVDLYRDDGDNTFDVADDIFLATVLTDGAGVFTLRTVSTGVFFAVVNEATLPTGHALTTSGTLTATFTGFGDTVDAGDIGEVAAANLSLTLTPSDATPIVGAFITLTVDINNAGPGSATGVVVDVPLPAGLAHVSNDGGGAYNSGTGVWTAGVVPPGTSTLQIQVRVANSDAFTVTAEVTASNEYDENSIPGNANTFEDDFATISFSILPETTLDTTPADPSQDDVTFTFSSNDGAATFQCSLDGAAFTTCTTPRALTSLSDGSHTFAVRAVDPVTGPDATPAIYTWDVDGTAPDTTIDTPPANPTNNANPIITFSSNEAGATFECSVDGAAFASCSSPLPFLGLAAGTHSLQVRAIDAAGNVDASPAVAVWVVDLTPPETTMLTGPPAQSTSSNATFTFSSNDAGATFECSLDGVAFSACPSPTTLINTPDGTHTFRVRAVDAAGNIDATPSSQTWEIETVEPETLFVSTPPDPSNQSNAAFEFASDEPNVTFACSLDGAPFAACTALTTFPALGDGPHSVAVKATDAFGNEDPTPANYSWTVDTAAPQTGIATAPPAVTADPSAVFAFTSTETNSTFTCSLDGGGFSPCLASTTFGGLTDGAHTLSVRATDAAGNTDATPATHAWRVDTDAPETTLVSGPANPSSSDNATFTFSSDEAGATFECALDAGAFAACATPRVFTGLADGEHTFRVRATDTAGNTDATPAIAVWTIDTGAPETTLLTTPSNPSAVADAAFDFDSDDVSAIFECSLDGAVFSVCTSPFTTTGLTDGAHTFSVRAVDTAGNADPTPASFAWTVDTAEPDTIIDVQPDAVSLDSDAVFAFSSNEATATFECSLDGAPFTACVSPSTLLGLTDGAHDFRVRAVDTAGNTDPTPAAFVWEIDTAAPETFLDVTPTNPSANVNGTFVFSSDDFAADFECSLDGALFTTCSSPHVENGLTEGPHTFRVRAVDAAGNVDATPAVYTWAVDSGAPESSILTGPSDPSNDTSPVLTFGSDDADATFECSLDGAVFAVCTSPRTLVGLSDGAHTFRVRAIDAAGNVDTTPAEQTWTVDTVVPETTIDTAPSGTVASTDASFAFSSDDAGATFQCSLDLGAFTACADTATFSGLSNGDHALRVRAVDAAGNFDLSPAEATWTVDVLAPETTIDTGPDNPSGSSDATFTFSSSEAGSTFECAVDGAAFSACTSPLALSGVAQGSHTFAVRATDAIGNVDATPATYDWVVNSVFPETTLDSAPDAFTNNTSATFDFSSNDASATFECSFEGAPFAACSSPVSESGLAEGTFVFLVRAINAGGTEDPSPASATFVVDVTDPAAPTLTAPSGSTALLRPEIVGTAEAFSTVTITIDGTVAGTAVVDGAGTFTFVPDADLAGGDHTVVASTTDRAGNSGPDSLPLAFEIAADSDDDGLSDDDEAIIGTDPLNPDTDGDGLLDGPEVGIGTNPLDPDTDGDTLGDGIEAPAAVAVDTDSDGVIDALDLDSEGDGILDSIEGTKDTDGDGIRNSLDDDDDEDGILTRREGSPFDPAPAEQSDGARFGTDVDGDGIENALDEDSDGDGVDDRTEGVLDGDGDGIPNYLDAANDGPTGDADGDTLTNAEEVALGTNPFNADTDGDGLEDAPEVGNVADPTDTDNDGIIDALEFDDDADGIPSRDEDDDGDDHGADLDTDGVTPRVDLESDGDTLTDAIEGAGDADGDGIPNYLDLDSDDDGAPDAVELDGDADNDGTPNFLDPNDSDGPNADADGDGLTNGEEASLGTNPNRPDTDGDGVGDFEEVGNIADPTDTDGDGTIDALAPDDDGDGILSSVEDTEGANFGADIDGDGIPPRVDTDSDGDDLTDALEGNGDADDDGIPNYLDLDSDGDGKTDEVEGAGDDDGDGVPNFLDPDDGDGPNADADGDGVPNLAEVIIGSDPNNPDTDGDGLDDGEEVGTDPRNPISTDGDGIPNVLDRDDDGDGINTAAEIADTTELGDADPDNDTVPAWLDDDSDGDSIADAIEGRGDADDDGTPNYLDLNSDGDTRTDAVEGTGDDDGDDIPNFLDPDDTGGDFDADADGLSNAIEVAIGTNPNNPDSDGDGVGDLAEVGDVDDPADTDGDGDIDALDEDDDDDGLLTFDEAADAAALGENDPDSDGRASWLDIDADGDGIEDGTEGLGDVDNDGLPNYLDVDSDGDGGLDSVEGTRDRDCDGIPNFLDADDATAPGCDGIDTDLDGVLDTVEFVLGTDPFNADTDGDGIDDGIETDEGSAINTDGDALIDALDEDSDGDGVRDIDEGLRDTDGDGTLDFRDEDDDDDGIDTRTEASPFDPVPGEITDGTRFGDDVDNDGLPNHLDRDSDGDGVLDVDEGTGDDDGDSIPNYLDAISDGPDADPDGDGLSNAEEALAGTNPLNPDSDGDQLPDGDEVGDPADPTDTDNDGTIDALDEDDDDDGISSFQEVEDANTIDGVEIDEDGDNRDNPYDDDSDGDGIPDAVEGRQDPDGDGIPAYVDLDSDDDGATDEDEGAGDIDNDGVPNFLDPDDTDGPDADADGDGLSNAEEALLGTDPNRADSDGDSVSDFDEVGPNIAAPLDTDGDLIIDALDDDDDGDGLLTLSEIITATDAGLSEDFDGDGRVNYRDTDSDADGINDGIEGVIDSDQDGAPNFLDADADGDGKPDAEEGIGDDDEDGVPNFLDPDDTDGPNADPDNDGLSNAEEVLIGTDPYREDSDGDGVLDGDEVGDDLNNPRNSDGDDLPDALDDDDDGDGIPTLDEREDQDEFGSPDDDGIPAYLDDDSDGDGIGDAVEGRIDSDGDGTPNYIDIDSDDDGIPDEVEGLADPDGDDIPAYLDDDSDGDGDSDLVEGSGDDDGDDIPNFLDSNDEDGPDGDEDGDGLSNERETQYGTDPLNPDSDDDGLSDGDEVDVHNTDPTSDDSDEDGLTDGDEVNVHGTDPNDTDTDNGGVDDGIEVEAGTDPLDPDDDAIAGGDPDGDGIQAGDNCPDVFNPDQIDVDGDDIGDLCDADALGDGIPDDFEIYGGGCACDAQGDARSFSGWALFFLLGGLGLRRLGARGRRRRSQGSAPGKPFAPQQCGARTQPSNVAGTVLGAMLFGVLGLTASTASAQVGSFPAERFRPAMDREGILDVESGEVGSHLDYDLAIWGGYALNPVNLYAREDGVNKRVGALVGHRIGLSVVGAISLFEWVELGFEMPFVALNLAGDLPNGATSTIFPVGTGDARIAPKIRLLRAEDHTVDLAVIPAFTLPTGLPFDSYMGEGFFTFAPELALSRDLEVVRLAGNVGVRLRPVHRLNNLITGQEVFYRAGVGVPLKEWTTLPLEVSASMSGAVGVFPILQGVGQAPLEVLGGATYDFMDRFQFFGGAGMGVLAGAAVPALRVFAGARYSPRVKDRDGDGIEDDKDVCPDEPEDKDGFDDADGCIDEDNDQDGILDTVDKCRDAKEDVDGFEDTDGCPEPDNDRDGIPDIADACPIQPEDLDDFKDDDGCPDDDNDNDGVLDVNDKCIMEPGVVAYEGCSVPDSDEDGITDDKDVCPDKAEDKDGFQDEDGCPDPDNDVDGILDANDKCPNVAEDKDGFEDEDGCVDLDNDQDGFLDADDKCPNEAEVINGVKDDDGCPDKGKTLVIIKREKIEILEKVYFNTGRDKIRNRSFNLLNQVGSILRAHPEVTKVRIEGHTDNVGKETNNLRLSQRRADAVKAFLIGTGVDPLRLDAIGFGETKPVTPNVNNAAREQNRRVEFRIAEVNGKPLDNASATVTTEKIISKTPAPEAPAPNAPVPTAPAPTAPAPTAPAPTAPAPTAPAPTAPSPK